MRQFKSIAMLIAASAILFNNGCGGGMSAPSDDDNISVVKVTDLRQGYLAKGIILVDEGENFRYDLGFCNDEMTMKITFDLDFVDDQYSEGTYEIVEESMIVYANGEAMIDTGESGSLEEGKTYIIEQSKGNLNWYVGSISSIECAVESI
jgi:hypothetical protein